MSKQAHYFKTEDQHGNRLEIDAIAGSVYLDSYQGGCEGVSMQFTTDQVREISRQLLLASKRMDDQYHEYDQ